MGKAFQEEGQVDWLDGQRGAVHEWSALLISLSIWWTFCLSSSKYIFLSCWGIVLLRGLQQERRAKAAWLPKRDLTKKLLKL
jgi:hypothetical protein